MFVSVLRRPRPGQPASQPTALVDLGRPAFKLGIAEIQVGWRAHELGRRCGGPRGLPGARARAGADRRAHRERAGRRRRGARWRWPRSTRGCSSSPANPSWKLLEAMMRRRGYAVRHGDGADAGRRQAPLRPEGAAAGRRAAAGSPRASCSTRSCSGRRACRSTPTATATVEVPLNDSITAFRIVAVASGGEALFGTGATSIRTTQDLMVLPGIAPLAREGDRMRSEVTLRNATDRADGRGRHGRGDGPRRDARSPRGDRWRPARRRRWAGTSSCRPG